MVKRIKLRTLFIGGCITLFFLVLVGRMFWIQVVQADFWKENAANQWGRTSTIPSTRGTIYDRNGNVMASDVPAYTVVVSPEVIHERGIADEVVTGLNKLLGKPEDELRKLVEAKGEEGNYLKSREVRNEGWKIDQDKADEVIAFRDELQKEHGIVETGIGLIREQKRHYAMDSRAAHVLGYVDRDGVAVAGLEYSLNEQLEGKDGKIVYQSDGKGIKLPDADETYEPVVNGTDFKLTIDSTIQYFVEEAMKTAFEQYQPKSMTVIAADPNTMDILAMANLPTFNPNEFWTTADNQGNFYNHAIKSIYEPGSTFKIVTLAGAVEENLFNPNATFQSGSIRIPNYSRPLYDINRVGWGEISYLEGVKRSSNVAFVKLGFEMLGKERLLKYIQDFGFGQRTGIDLPGESRGLLTPQYDVEYATLSYGHGKVQVTPLQQLTAVSAIANGGKLLKPHVVKESVNPNNGEKTVTQTEVVHQVLSEQAALKTGEYLEQVVADQVKGTGRHAYIEGYRVAGKTGTAIKVSGQEYDRSKVLVSFIGYAPVDDPKIALIVIIDEPNEEVGGGQAAAPVFKEIVSNSLQYMGVPKNAGEIDKGTSQAEAVIQRKTPDLAGQSMQEARNALLQQGFDFEAIGEGGTVESQYPAAGTPLMPGQRIFLLSQLGDQTAIPDLRGESLRDALEVLSLLKVGIRVDGEGYISGQEVINQDGKRTVELKLAPINVYGEDIPVTPADEENGEENEHAP